MTLPEKAWQTFTNNLTTNPQAIQQIESAKQTSNYKTTFHELTNLFGEYNIEAKEAFLHHPTIFINQVESIINQTAKSTIAWNIPEPIKLNIEYPELTPLPINEIRRQHINTLQNIIGDIFQKGDLEITNFKAYYKCTTTECNNTATRTKENNRELRPTLRCDKCHGIMERIQTDMIDQIILHISQPYNETAENKKIGAIIQNQHTHPDIEKRLTYGTRVRIFGLIDTYKTKTAQKYVIIPLGITIIGTDLDLIKPTPEDLTELQNIQKTTPLPTYFRQQLFPNIIGHDLFIESQIVAVIGAPNKTDGIDFQRGNPHSLTIGDPGLIKTKTMNILINLIPKARIANAGTTTTAGITATTIKDEYTGDYDLQMGAIGLADQSVLGIEEGGLMNKETLDALHSVMELGKLPIDKGGHHTSIPCDTTIDVTSNPIGGMWNRQKPYSEQLPFSRPFLDRFDFLNLLTDIPDQENDAKIYDSMSENKKIPTETIQLFRKYWLLARRLQTTLSPQAISRGKQFYLEQRKKTNPQGVPTISARAAIGIQRIATARARAQLKQIATIEDMEWAVNTYTQGRLPILSHDGNIEYNEMVIPDKSKSKTTIETEIIKYLKDNDTTHTPEEIHKHLQTILELRHVHILDIENALTDLLKYGDIIEPTHGKYQILN